MGGILNALIGRGARLAAQLGIGNNGSGTYGYFTGVFGTLSPAVLPAATIDVVEWDNTSSGFLLFKLHGTSIANSDATFTALNIDGHALARAAATYTANDGLGHTQWAWAPNTSAYPTTGTKAFTVQ